MVAGRTEPRDKGILRLEEFRAVDQVDVSVTERRHQICVLLVSLARLHVPSLVICSDRWWDKARVALLLEKVGTPDARQPVVSVSRPSSALRFHLELSVACATVGR
ncbi:hypothetical protein AERO9AM_50147 [Aeromicrobium sp. 9AM]|nr:hypothetical protein AERO9AM_50147 [Aeromicrobium sp. 9AM]